MVKVKEMPYREKYAKALDSMKTHETFISSFVKEHLDDQTLAELKGFGGKGLGKSLRMLHMRRSMI